jgi:hypothetical protein
MSVESKVDPGLVVLSMGESKAVLFPRDYQVTILIPDGGGIRGFSSLLILRECMARLQHQLGKERMPEVYEHFDIIGGTGTGRYALQWREDYEALTGLVHEASLPPCSGGSGYH